MPASSWIAHVKAYYKKHGGTYSQALKGAAKTWKKGGTADAKKKAPRKRRRKK